MKYTSIVVITLVMFVGCRNGVDGEDVVEKSSFQMPMKENTWVRKETVRKTKADIFSNAKNVHTKIPIDPTLEAELKKSVVLSVNTQQECSEHSETLDKRRIKVQSQGGVWHAYERNLKAKHYSNDGMQLDSQTNRLVFSIKHICNNAKGIHLDGWGTKTVERYGRMGEEGYINYFINLGEVQGDIDRWVRFAEFAIKSRDRNVPYSAIGESIGKAKRVLDLYDDLSQRKITDNLALQKFLTEGATLLSVINDSLTTDPRLILALQYEEMFPFEDIEGEM
jgi:hypothetical protein